MAGMRVLTDKVVPVGNTVVLEEFVPEGTAVDFVLHEAEDSEDFVRDELRRELSEASEAAKRGETVDMQTMLAEAAAHRHARRRSKVLSHRRAG